VVVFELEISQNLSSQVVGYHAGGIHVMMNLLALALHNGFDINVNHIPALLV